MYKTLLVFISERVIDDRIHFSAQFFYDKFSNFHSEMQLYESTKKRGMVFYNPVLDQNDIPWMMEKTNGKIGPDDEVSAF